MNLHALVRTRECDPLGEKPRRSKAAYSGQADPLSACQESYKVTHGPTDAAYRQSGAVRTSEAAQPGLACKFTSYTRSATYVSQFKLSPAGAYANAEAAAAGATERSALTAAHRAVCGEERAIIYDFPAFYVLFTGTSGPSPSSASRKRAATACALSSAAKREATEVMDVEDEDEDDDAGGVNMLSTVDPPDTNNNQHPYSEVSKDAVEFRTSRRHIWELV